MPTVFEQFEVAQRAWPRAAEVLGNTISYTVSGADPVEIPGFVDFNEVNAAGGIGGAVSQDIEVEIDFAFLPVRPAPTGQLSFTAMPALAGKSYRPINVRMNETGDGWLFNVSEIR